ncbi:MAG: glycosyltransferase family 2 protein [Bacteroidetes bacterium]|nr:glycosyltransferase family 2 protein [Bacteroidota bacterium]MBS1943462.1 glycosyltransferase family 2 protein [Bacteroidota bacterium]
MDTAVVILNWNGQKWLERFLPGVVAHTGADARIVVADNASTDGSIAWLRANWPEVEVVEMPTNEGFAGGYNIALAQLEEKYFVLLNSDVEVTPGWAATLRNHLEQHPDMAACQPKMLSHANRNRFEHAGAAGGYIDRNGYPFCRGRIFEITEEDQGQYNDVRDVFWATGACLMIRSEAFRAAGGFDASLFAHMEEIDLCWCLRRMGWRIGYTSAATVYHVGGGALGYGNPRKTFLNFRNSLAVLTKHLDSRWIYARIIHRIVLDVFAALKFLAEGHAAHTRQVFRAHWNFTRWLPRLLRERKRLRKLETRPDLTGMYHRSIAYDRYILGWRNFAQLDRTAFDQPARRSK